MQNTCPCTTQLAQGQPRPGSYQEIVSATQAATATITGPTGFAPAALQAATLAGA